MAFALIFVQRSSQVIKLLFFLHHIDVLECNDIPHAYCSTSVYSNPFEYASQASYHSPQKVVLSSISQSSIPNRIPPSIRGSRLIKQYITRNGKLMRRKNRLSFFIAMLLALSITSASHWIILTILANSSVEEAKDWCLKFLISLGQDIICGQLVRFLLQLAAIKTLARHGVSSSLLTVKIMRLFADKLVIRAVGCSRQSQAV